MTLSCMGHTKKIAGAIWSPDFFSLELLGRRHLPTMLRTFRYLLIAKLVAPKSCIDLKAGAHQHGPQAANPRAGCAYLLFTPLTWRSGVAGAL